MAAKKPTKTDELLAAIGRAPSDGQAKALGNELLAHLIEQRHAPKLAAIKGRLSNWLCHEFENERLLNYDATRSGKSDGEVDLSEYDHTIHNIFLSPAPEVEAAEDIDLDQVDVSASGSENCILRFRLGDKWYVAEVAIREDG